MSRKPKPEPARLDEGRDAAPLTELRAPVHVGREGTCSAGNASLHVDLTTGRRTRLDGASEPGFRVGSVEVEGARLLLTIGPEHACWQAPDVPVGCRGMIVRVRPPESATDVEVALVEVGIRESGAAAVRVEQARRSAVVVEPSAPRPHARARDVVLGIARESNVEEREKLVELVENILGRCGL